MHCGRCDSRRASRMSVLSGREALAKILSDNKIGEIFKYAKECAKIGPYEVEEMAKLTGMSIDEVSQILFKVNPEIYFGNVSELSKDVAQKAKVSDSVVNVLYDTSISMDGPRYPAFHKKMESIFKELELQGVIVKIYYFSDPHISKRPPKTLSEFCRGVSKAERGCTYPVEAWNQIIDGIVLFITDGEFHDPVSSFKKLTEINELVLACPSWATIGPELIQQLCDKIGTIPLTYLDKFDSRDLTSVVKQIKDGSDVIAIPSGVMRYGTLFFPKFFLLPSMLGTTLNFLIENKSECLLKLQKMFQEMILSIHRTMKVDFVGTLTNPDSRALLKIVSTMKSIADVQMDSEIQEKDIPDMWNSFYYTLKDLMDFGSQEKKKRGPDISVIWDECFSADESFQILRDKAQQTHTLIFRKNECPCAVLKEFRTAHALSALHRQCLYLLFSKARIVRGVVEGPNHYPVYESDLLNTMRLLPCKIFRSGDEVSFTFQKTVVYRLMCMIVAHMMGPGKDNYQSDLKTIMMCSLNRIPKKIYMGITEVDIMKPSADKNKSTEWLRCLLQISRIPEILDFTPEKISKIRELYQKINIYYM